MSSYSESAIAPRTEKDDGWCKEIPTEVLYNDYVAAAEKIGEKRKREETVFSRCGFGVQTEIGFLGMVGVE